MNPSLSQRTHAAGDGILNFKGHLFNNGLIKPNLPQRPKKSRSKSFIISTQKTKFSKRFTGTGNLKSNSSSAVTRMKMPWVHAPGKTTSITSACISSAPSLIPSNRQLMQCNSHSKKSKSREELELDRLNRDINSSMTSTSSPNSSTEESYENKYLKSNSKPKQRQSRPPSSVRTVSDLPNQHNQSTSSIESKNSLVHVSNFLQNKRDEILRLLKDSHKKELSPDLIANLVKASSLCKDAMKELEHLRHCIKKLQTKESSLSDDDCNLLDKMKVKVISKVRAFQEIDEFVHNMVEQENTRSENGYLNSRCDIGDIRSPASNKTINPQPLLSPSASSSNAAVLIFRNPGMAVYNRSRSKSAEVIGKERFEDLENSSVDSFRNHYENSEYYDNQSTQKNIRKTTPIAAKSATSTSIDINSLDKLYKQDFDSIRRKESNESNLSSNPNRLVHFDVMTSEEEVLKTEINSTAPSQLNFYKEKVCQLQRQLMDAEAEMIELKDDLHRVESETNFQVRFLKSNFEDRLENLEQLPEYLNLSEGRLNETLQLKRIKELELEKELEVKNNEIERLKKINSGFKDEMDMLQVTLKRYQHSDNESKMKIHELERINSNLRKEVEETNSELGKLTHKLNSTSFTSLHTVGSQDNHDDLIASQQRLKFKYQELKNQLAKAHRNVHILKVTKEKMISRLTTRLEEIMTELEESRLKNKQLKNQIMFIRSSYDDTFPTGVFHLQQPQKNSPKRILVNRNISTTVDKKSPSNIKKKTNPPEGILKTNRKITTEEKKHSDHTITKAEVVEPEPIISTMKAWITGHESRECDDANYFLHDIQEENSQRSKRSSCPKEKDVVPSPCINPVNLDLNATNNTCLVNVNQ